MQERRRILHPAFLVLVAIVTVIAAIAGCSSGGPESPWSSETGDVSGTVTSNRGSTLPGIEICLCDQSGELIGGTATDSSGGYWLADITLSEPQASSETFWLYVNRVHGSTSAVDRRYGTFGGEVTVQAGSAVTLDIVLDEVGPGDPAEYVGP